MLIACALNPEMLKKVTESGAGVQCWYDLWKSVPEAATSYKDIDEVQRMWLAVFDTVPRRDYNLKERLAAEEK